jgi:hypothetical protein
MTDREARFWRSVKEVDLSLDEGVGEPYKVQPLAQDWARVSKVVEEAGEAIDALIGITAQNPRKGYYANKGDLYGELADTAMTAILALQHFTKDEARTREILLAKAEYIAVRAGIDLSAAPL